MTSVTVGCDRQREDALGAASAPAPSAERPSAQMHPVESNPNAMPNDAAHRGQGDHAGHDHDDHAGHDHGPGEGHGDSVSTGTPSGENTLAEEALTAGTERGVRWSAPSRWPTTGENSEFRAQTFRLPAVSMDGAGECVVYRFPGGGDVQANLHRWIGQFRGADGTSDSVDAMQAERVVNGLPAWLVRATGTYVSQGPTLQGPEERFEGWALFGAVVVSAVDPVFVKCTGPELVIAREAAAILRFVDSIEVSAAPVD